MSMKLIQAAVDHYHAQRSQATAHLEILLTKSVGIGEHTDLSAEVRKWTEEIAQAEECLGVLRNIVQQTGEQQ